MRSKAVVAIFLCGFLLLTSDLGASAQSSPPGIEFLAEDVRGENFSISADGSTVALYSYPSTIVIIDRTDRSKDKTLRGFQPVITSDGKSVLYRDGAGTVLYDLTGDVVVRNFEGLYPLDDSSGPQVGSTISEDGTKVLLFPGTIYGESAPFVDLLLYDRDDDSLTQIAEPPMTGNVFWAAINLSNQSIHFTAEVSNRASEIFRYEWDEDKLQRLTFGANQPNPFRSIASHSNANGTALLVRESNYEAYRGYPSEGKVENTYLFNTFSGERINLGHDDLRDDSHFQNMIDSSGTRVVFDYRDRQADEPIADIAFYDNGIMSNLVDDCCGYGPEISADGTFVVYSASSADDDSTYTTIYDLTLPQSEATCRINFTEGQWGNSVTISGSSETLLLITSRNRAYTFDLGPPGDRCTGMQAETPTPTPAPTPDTVRIAIVGDSYISGEGILSRGGEAPSGGPIDYECGTDIHNQDSRGPRWYAEGTNVRFEFDPILGPNSNVTAFSVDFDVLRPEVDAGRVRSFYDGAIPCFVDSGLEADPVEVLGRVVSGDLKLIKSENLCHRSNATYVHHLAKELQADIVNIACSGAKVINVTSTLQNPEAVPQYPESDPGNFGRSPQILTLRSQQNIGGGRFDAIFVSIGGNDLGFGGIVASCINPVGGSCARANKASELFDRAAIVGNDVEDALAQILEATSGESEVYLVGYPNIVSPESMQRCIELWRIDLNNQFHWSEVEFFQTALLPKLNTALEHAARRAGVRFINLDDVFETDEQACGIAIPGIIGGDDYLGPLGRNFGNESLHPNHIGHEIIFNEKIEPYAALVGNQIPTNPAPDRTTSCNDCWIAPPTEVSLFTQRTDRAVLPTSDDAILANGRSSLPARNGHFGVDACHGGSVNIVISGGGTELASLDLDEQALPGAGTHSAPVGNLRHKGDAAVEMTINCPNGTTTVEKFNIYIDPSGVVSDELGDPIEGAVVTLLRSPTAAGPFLPVPSGSDIMSPENRVNPIQTLADGVFQWDTVAGFYKVHAEANGCVDPFDPTRTSVTTGVLEVPPPQIGIDLALDCASLTDVVTTPTSQTPAPIPTPEQRAPTATPTVAPQTPTPAAVEEGSLAATPTTASTALPELTLTAAAPYSCGSSIAGNVSGGSLNYDVVVTLTNSLDDSIIRFPLPTTAGEYEVSALQLARFQDGDYEVRITATDVASAQATELAYAIELSAACVVGLLPAPPLMVATPTLAASSPTDTAANRPVTTSVPNIVVATTIPTATPEALLAQTANVNAAAPAITAPTTIGLAPATGSPPIMAAAPAPLVPKPNAATFRPPSAKSANTTKAGTTQLAHTGTESEILMRFGIMAMLAGIFLIALSNTSVSMRRGN